MLKIEQRLKRQLAKRRCTLLGIGPMSKNCVDATISLAHEHAAPLMLIASRRQIETAACGGGYVNNWTTQKFASYVQKKDPARQLILARDHGGPWQNYQEVTEKMDIKHAMESCKRSYAVDIESGLQVIHIDPSIDVFNKAPSQTVLMERLFELYEYCYSFSRKKRKDIIFEIGTEEQSGEQHNVGELRSFLHKVTTYCTKNKLPPPFFVVVQTGTKVKEMSNVGNLSADFRVKDIIPPEVHIAKLVEVCEKYSVHLKEHNTDYLPDDTLRWHPQVGIHAANVAPEFGVAETKHIIKLCEEFRLKKELSTFLRLAYDSGKWQKWLLPKSNLSDTEKAIVAGHYVLSDPEFLACKKKIKHACHAHGVDLDVSIQNYLKQVIRRYLYNFNLM